MTIKDKITPEIKNKFRDALRRTIDTGREHAFIMCRDDKGNLYPRDICEGEECEVKMESPALCFPHRTQGNFHTHADTSVVRRIFKDTEKRIPKEIIISYVEDVARSEGIDVTTPSYGDLVNTLINKCIERTEGTVCVGSDANLDRVDCWTVNNTITEDDCGRARTLKLLGMAGEGPPKPWIKPLFDKEIINLENDGRSSSD